MSRFSRRSFVAMAGSGVALAACSADSKAGNKESSVVTTGPSYHHGTLAHLGKPAGTNLPPFEPEFLTAVYLRFGSKGNKHALIARHGYAQFAKGAKPEDIQAIAERELAVAQKPNGKWNRPNDSAKKEWRRESNLEKFDFDSQNVIFILLDNAEDEYRFDDRIEKGTGNGTDGTRANLIRFTHFAGQSDASEIDYTPVQPNNAFVNARLISGLAGGPFDGKKILRIENWYVDSDGQLLTGTPKLLYSMNLHLLATTEGGTVLPVIIDPDTGNGMANRP